MKINISIECSNEDEALDVVSKIAGITSDTSTTTTTKKATPKQAAAAATTEDATPPSKPATAKKKKAAPKKKAASAPTVDELKAKILEAAGGDMTNPEVAANVKEYVASMGVAKISDMDEETRQSAFDGAEAYFEDGDEGDDEEDDPMA